MNSPQNGHGLAHVTHFWMLQLWIEKFRHGTPLSEMNNAVNAPMTIDVRYAICIRLIDVCRAMPLSTSSTAASLRRRLPVASGSDLQVDTSSSCPVTVAPVSAVGRFLLQARWSGTHFQIFLRDTSLSKDTFRRSLKTYFFALY